MNRKIIFETLVKCKGNIYNLAGDHNRQARQLIYSELTGQRQPVSKSGVNNIINAVYKLVNADNYGNCTAEKCNYIYHFAKKRLQELTEQETGKSENTNTQIIKLF